MFLFFYANLGFALGLQQVRRENAMNGRTIRQFLFYQQYDSSKIYAEID